MSTTMTEPKYGKDRLQLPHLQLTIDVGSYVKSDKGSILLLIDYRQDKIGQKSVLVSEYLVDKSKRTVKQLTNVTEQWIPATKLCDIVFVLEPAFSTIDKFIWIGRGDTFVNDSDNNQYTFPCNSPLFTLDQSVSKMIWNEIQRI